MVSRKNESRDVDYTVPGLVVIVALVVVTGFFLRGWNGETSPAADVSNLGGLAYGTPDVLEPARCEVASFCDGSRLLRQDENCVQYEAFCTYGCSYQDGSARCNS